MTLLTPLAVQRSFYFYTAMNEKKSFSRVGGKKRKAKPVSLLPLTTSTTSTSHSASIIWMKMIRRGWAFNEVFVGSFKLRAMHVGCREALWKLHNRNFLTFPIYRLSVRQCRPDACRDVLRKSMLSKRSSRWASFLDITDNHPKYYTKASQTRQSFCSSHYSLNCFKSSTVQSPVIIDFSIFFVRIRSYQFLLSPPFAVISRTAVDGWWGRLNDDEKIFVKFKLSSYNKSSESSSSEALSAGSSVLSPIINIFERFFCFIWRWLL